MDSWPTPSPPKGIKELILYTLRDILFHPSRWLTFSTQIRPLWASLIWNRRINLLRSYLSIGMPWDLQQAPSYTPHLNTTLKKLLSAHRSGRQNNLPKVEDLPVKNAWFEEAIILSHTLFEISDNTFKTPELDSETIAETYSETSDQRRRILYISHSWPGDRWNGYAIRTHKIASALIRYGHDVEVLCRPKPFQHDKPSSRIEKMVHENVTYSRYIERSASVKNLSPYIHGYAKAIDQKIKSFQPDIIHAASNFITGTAAAIAAQKNKRPFIYEVRGLWEITRLVTHSNYRRSVGFKAQSNLETLCANRADHVLTLNMPLKNTLIKRGAKPANISLLPNCGGLDPDLSGDLTELHPHLTKLLSRPDERNCIFGYVGSLTDYEGLFLLIEAFELACKKTPFITLVIAGQGALSAALLSRIKASAVSTRIFLLGPLSPLNARTLIASLDVMVVARLANDVTKIVPPLKPLTAFSVGTPCLLSNLPPLLEYVEEAETSLIVKAGNRKALMKSMVLLANDPQRRKAMGKNALDWIEKSRNWESNVATLNDLYTTLLLEN